MPGVRQKPPSQLANSRGGRGRGLTVVVPGHREVPRMPAAAVGMPWTARTRFFWRSFWKSEVSLAVDRNADAERLFRWLEAFEEREKLLGEVREHGYAPARRVISEEESVDGTTVIILMSGAHPHLAYIKHLDREIARLSEHFGMTPLSRFRLQLTATEAKRSANDLRRDLMAPPKDADVLDLDQLA